MSKATEIISWNLRDGLNSTAIQEAIIDTDLDIGVFPEAAKEATGLETSTVHAFENTGYNVFAKPYDDVDGRLDRHTLAVVAKPELIREAYALRLVGRTAIRLELMTGTSFTGLHLDDRLESTRQRQVASLLRPESLEDALGWNAVVAGDLNAMHGTDTAAKVLHAVEPIVRLLPYRNPGEKTNKLQRVSSLGRRLTAMADGGTMHAFQLAGFDDADPMHQPTMKKGPLAAQLDHILYRGNHVSVNEPTVIESGDGLSDHRRIRASLYL